MTATVGGYVLLLKLQDIIGEIGLCPHSKLNPAAHAKKQGTRLIKVGCKCGTIARMSRTAFEAMDWTCTTCEETIDEME